MIKVNDIIELQKGDKIQCTLNPEWGVGEVLEIVSKGQMRQVDANHDEPKKSVSLAKVLFMGKDLFDDIEGVRFITHIIRDDIYKIV